MRTKSLLSILFSFILSVSFGQRAQIADSLKAMRLARPYVLVSESGGKANDLVNDSPSLIKAIQYGKAKGKKHIMYGAGRYIQSPLDITSASDSITIQGVPGSTIIVMNSTPGDAAFAIKNTKHIVLKDLIIDCSAGSLNGGVGIFGSSNCVLDNVTVIGADAFSIGVYGKYSNGSGWIKALAKDNLVKNSKIRGQRRYHEIGGTYGLTAGDSAVNTTFMDVLVQDCFLSTVGDYAGSDASVNTKFIRVITEKTTAGVAGSAGFHFEGEQAYANMFVEVQDCKSINQTIAFSVSENTKAIFTGNNQALNSKKALRAVGQYPVFVYGLTTLNCGAGIENSTTEAIIENNTSGIYENIHTLNTVARNSFINYNGNPANSTTELTAIRDSDFDKFVSLSETNVGSYFVEISNVTFNNTSLRWYNNVGLRVDITKCLFNNSTIVGGRVKQANITGGTRFYTTNSAATAIDLTLDNFNTTVSHTYFDGYNKIGDNVTLGFGIKQTNITNPSILPESVLVSTADIDSVRTYPALALNSTAPSGVSAPGTPFRITAAGTAAANTPIVTEWTRDAESGDVILLTGENFTATTVFKVFAGGIMQTAKVITIDSQKAAIELPPSEFGIYVIWGQNANGKGSPFLVNRARAWWLEDRVAAGLQASIFGENLANRHGNGNTYVYIRPTGGGTGQYCTVSESTPYEIQYTVPVGLAAGSYYVWAHNGYGGIYGWSPPLTLTLTETTYHVKTRATGPLFNITDYGAVPNNTAVNNAPAIKQAAQAAAAATPVKGTVVFGTGPATWTIKSEIETRNEVQYLGFANGNGDPGTVISVPSSYTAGFFGIYGNFDTVESIKWSNVVFSNPNGYETNLGNSKVFMYNRFKNAQFLNCWWDYGIEGEIWRMYGGSTSSSSQGVYYTNCKFVGKQISMAGINGVYFENCTHYFRGNALFAMKGGAVNGLVVRGGTFQDKDLTSTSSQDDQGVGRIGVFSGEGSANRHIYITKNKGYKLGPRYTGTNKPDQNMGEVWMVEGSGEGYRNYAVTSSGSSLTLSGTAPTTDAVRPNFAVLRVIAGKGIGITRWVVTNDGAGHLTVDEPFPITLDGTSLLSIGADMDRMVLYDNYAQGKDSLALKSDHNATVFIMLYGGGNRVIVDKNIVDKLRLGLTLWGSMFNSTEFLSSQWNKYQYNTLSRNRWGIALFARPENESYVFPATALLANLFRHNIIKNPVLDDIQYYLHRPGVFSKPAIDLMIFDRNTLSNANSEWNHNRESEGQVPIRIPAGQISNQRYWRSN